MIARTSEFVVKKNKMEVVKEAIRRYFHTVHVSEPGTRMFISLQDEENDFKLCNMMVFESEGAARKHFDAQYTQDFNEFLKPNCKTGPTTKNYRYIAGL